MVDERERDSIEPGAGELLKEREQGLTTAEMEAQKKVQQEKERLEKLKKEKLKADLQNNLDKTEQKKKKFFGPFSVEELILALALLILGGYVLSFVFRPTLLSKGELPDKKKPKQKPKAK